MTTSMVKFNMPWSMGDIGLHGFGFQQRNVQFSWDTRFANHLVPYMLTKVWWVSRVHRGKATILGIIVMMKILASLALVMI